jgi:hypothetical protein
MIALMAAAAIAAGAPPSTAQSLQAMFDSATAAADGGKCAEAIESFASLEANASFQHSPMSLAVVRIRRGDCLLLVGRPHEAEAELTKGLDGLTSTATAYRGDVRIAHMDLGRIAYLGLDYGDAKRQFEIAGPGETPQERIGQLIWLTRATLFDEGSDALNSSTEALTLATSTPGIPKTTLADVHTIHARVLINHGEAKEGYAELVRALNEQGGLDLHINASELVTRSDLAIAALLVHDDEAARKYLGYTGAGRSNTRPFASAASMGSPACGGPADLKPDDFAVVEFGVEENGAVGYANPVYASRTGPIAVEFARAVARWSWKPADAKVLPPLFRLLTRVEVRCSTTNARPSVVDLLLPDVNAWLKTQGVSWGHWSASAAEALSRERTELAALRPKGGPGLIPPLVEMSQNPIAGQTERQSWAVEARDIAIAAGAPPKVRTYLELNVVELSITSRRPGALGSGQPGSSQLDDFLLDPDIAADARSADTVRLVMNDWFEPSADRRSVLLGAVAEDQRLPAHDPLRVGALLRLASIQARDGDLNAARSSYERTGLQAQQCALVDAKPDLRARPNVGNAFPEEAQRWGFEGWVRTEYDIAPDGRTLNQRALIAYPPFVFRNAAVGIAKDFRFIQTYRPEGGPGCSGAQTQINFVLPQHAAAGHG